MKIFDNLFGHRSDGCDGSSYETAIKVASAEEEYQWIRRNCPGFRVDLQLLYMNKGKPYDVIRCRNDKGKTCEIYFDISQFYGKM